MQITFQIRRKDDERRGFGAILKKPKNTSRYDLFLRAH